MPKKDLQDLESRLLRALADYQNLEKRHATDRIHLVKYANQALLDKLLPLLDDLYRAQEHLNDAGLKIVIDQFEKILFTEGVTEIAALGAQFDPETMDCTQVVPGEKNHVISVVSRGFLYQDKVLRPARVEVGGGK